MFWRRSYSRRFDGTIIRSWRRAAADSRDTWASACFRIAARPPPGERSAAMLARRDAVAMTFSLRPARLEDVAELEPLIAISARTLLAPWYSPAQIDAAVGSVFAVDTQLIDDGTYFVAAQGPIIVGCGGW